MFTFQPEVVKPSIDLSKLNIYGPGVEPGVKCLQPTHFIIDAKQAGAGEVEVELSDTSTGGAVDIDVLDNNDGSYTVKYTAPKAGIYQVRLLISSVPLCSF